MRKPLLTVCVITYNHKKYIKQCLDSILSQEVNFSLQIVVADDCSTDGTRGILQQYKDKYADKVHLILQEKNVGPEQNWFDLLAYPTSRYVLYTEGDDYFIDNHKLQKQVDFLEKNRDHRICFHPVKVVFDDHSRPDHVYPAENNPAQFTPEELLRRNYIQTNSAMYRRIDYSKIPKGIVPGDWYLHICHATKGRIGFINEVMTVYRRHRGGAWWRDKKNQLGFWQRNAKGHLHFFEEVEKLFATNDQALSIIKEGAANTIEQIFFEAKSPDGTILKQELAAQFSKYVALGLDQCLKEGVAPQFQIQELKRHITYLTTEREALERQAQHLSEELDLHRTKIRDMEQSRSWRLTKPLRAINKLHKPKK